MHHRTNSNLFGLKELLLFCFVLCLSVGLWGQTAKDYQKAAKKGNAEAQYQLGLCYANGLGVAQDYGQSIAKWLSKAMRAPNIIWDLYTKSEVMV